MKNITANIAFYVWNYLPLLMQVLYWEGNPGMLNDVSCTSMRRSICYKKCP